MAQGPSKSGIILARITIILGILLLVLGTLWYGLSIHVLQRAIRNILVRPGGSFSFRVYVQPLMAILAATYDGIADARAGRSPYLWTIMTSRPERVSRLREGLLATSRIVLLGIIVDTVYQLVDFKTFYPGEAIVFALLLAFVPYLLSRGPIACLAWWWRRDIGVSNGHEARDVRPIAD